VAPHPVTNREMTKAIANVLHRPLWLPPVPGFVLSMLVGEMAEIVLNGSNVSSERIQKTGFKFQFPQLTEALKDLLQSANS
jgi:NAD dependent epimerase/dehydratase family enzyme